MTVPLPYPNLSRQPLVDVLRLIRTLNVGPVTFFQLVQRFGNAGAALEALPDLSLRGGRRAALQPSSHAVAIREIEATERLGARLIVYGSPDYPQLLHMINDPPPIITALGHPHLWQQKPCVAVVGARNASANGCQFAGKLAKDLGEAGMLIISGLARGIDTFAHKGALPTGTVAVIAGGIDNIYPPENDLLYAQIKEHGAIISEQPLGAAPFSGSFPGRNRMIAGMSLGTLVVEASPKSGSLITARFANEYGREVFAVPGSPLDPRSKGCNKLIKEGATMVEAASDILQALHPLLHRPLAETTASTYHNDTKAHEPDERELESARRILRNKLSVTAVSVDELMEQCQVAPSALLTVLLEMELGGRLVRHRGNQVALLATFDDEVA